MHPMRTWLLAAAAAAVIIRSQVKLDRMRYSPGAGLGSAPASARPGPEATTIFVITDLVKSL